MLLKRVVCNQRNISPSATRVRLLRSMNLLVPVLIWIHKAATRIDCGKTAAASRDQVLPFTEPSSHLLPPNLTLDLSDDAFCNDLSNVDSKVLLSPLSYKWIHSFPLCLNFFASIFVQKHRQVSQYWTHCSPIKVTLRGTVERLLRVTVLMIFLVEQPRL